MQEIKSIEEELADCRAAFAAHPNTTHAWCIHHEEELEATTEPIKNRIQFILDKKAVKEQAIRFRNLRPARNLPVELVEAHKACEKTYAAYDQAREAYWKAEEAHEKAWKACAKTWEAHAKAWKACAAKLSELHTRDWPDHTWNGESIF